MSQVLGVTSSCTITATSVSAEGVSGEVHTYTHTTHLLVVAHPADAYRVLHGVATLHIHEHETRTTKPTHPICLLYGRTNNKRANTTKETVDFDRKSDDEERAGKREKISKKNERGLRKEKKIVRGVIRTPLKSNRALHIEPEPDPNH